MDVNVFLTQSITMISKADKSILRGTIFKHLDGIVTAPALMTLSKHGVLESLLQSRGQTLDELSNKFKANDGYINVALRSLASQGWLNQTIENDLPSYGVTDKGAIAFTYANHYEKAVELIKIGEHYHPRKFEPAAFRVLESAFDSYLELQLKKHDAADDHISVLDQMLVHIEGVILGPSIVHLGMSGMFHKYFMESSFKAEEFHEDVKPFSKLLDIFTHFGWFEKTGETYRFTPKGLFYSRRASAYGVTVSYLPSLRKLDDLIFGNALILQPEKGGPEKHVDRAMNVWGSGGAHSTYFKVVDELIIEIFNRPLEKQPKGILDMGCGNGAFLQHLFEVIDQHTLRGKYLDEHPLTLVGVDYNEAALKITKANLIQADIWAKVIWGDIGDPAQLATSLETDYGVDLSSLLNVRTFLDHNRPWNAPVASVPSTVKSSGAYASKGMRLTNDAAQQSFVEHMQRWQPYLKQHGLLVIELHTVKPETTAKNLGKTGATAYDATHGYSDQYILEVDAYYDCIRRAGLERDERLGKQFPDSELATVTINLLK